MDAAQNRVRRAVLCDDLASRSIRPWVHWDIDATRGAATLRRRPRTVASAREMPASARAVARRTAARLAAPSMQYFEAQEDNT
jgi:hypothetical protein